MTACVTLVWLILVVALRVSRLVDASGSSRLMSLGMITVAVYVGWSWVNMSDISRLISVVSLLLSAYIMTKSRRHF